MKSLQSPATEEAKPHQEKAVGEIVAALEKKIAPQL